MKTTFILHHSSKSSIGRLHSIYSGNIFLSPGHLEFCNKIRYAFHLRTPCYIMDTSDHLACVQHSLWVRMLDAPNVCVSLR